MPEAVKNRGLSTNDFNLLLKTYYIFIYVSFNMEGSDKLITSLEKSFDFIRNNQANGVWSDFLTLAGESVFWVSGYVGYALSINESVQDSLILYHAARNILSNQSEEGGWSYGPNVPPDADSTSWCVKYLSKVKMLDIKSSSKAISFLLKHQNSNGGFRTYQTSDRIRRAMGLKNAISSEGWNSSQICVTAVALQAILVNQKNDAADKGIRFIERSQSKQGFWQSYWWTEKFYSTYYCMEVLCKNYGNNNEQVDKAKEWIARTQHDDGSWGEYLVEGIPFSTALALRGLMLGENREFTEHISRGINWLYKNQRQDGSWGPNYIFRIPDPSVKDPWNQVAWSLNGRCENAVIKDHRRLFSTATVFSALSEYRKFFNESS